MAVARPVALLVLLTRNVFWVLRACWGWCFLRGRVAFRKVVPLSRTSWCFLRGRVALKKAGTHRPDNVWLLGYSAALCVLRARGGPPNRGGLAAGSGALLQEEAVVAPALTESGDWVPACSEPGARKGVSEDRCCSLVATCVGHGPLAGRDADGKFFCEGPAPCGNKAAGWARSLTMSIGCLLYSVAGARRSGGGVRRCVSGRALVGPADKVRRGQRAKVFCDGPAPCGNKAAGWARQGEEGAAGPEQLGERHPLQERREAVHTVPCTAAAG
ncbi:hypothetical protein NDU88_005071 [Pleurodeles waltl]|uniref:Secreted protein n=1 Tax=Pleurodeles waltl TaxID=8319 RepID=A0AAV7NLN2_PLEWA|nr:hypothetical protein NDU88_005071 [Pleurodeles waltl]